MWQLISQIDSESVWKSISHLVTQLVSRSVSRNKSKKKRSERDRLERDRRERILLERDESGRNRSDRHTPESHIFSANVTIQRNLSRKIWMKLWKMSYFVRSNIFEIYYQFIFNTIDFTINGHRRFSSVSIDLFHQKNVFLFLHSISLENSYFHEIEKSDPLNFFKLSFEDSCQKIRIVALYNFQK